MKNRKLKPVSSSDDSMLESETVSDEDEFKVEAVLDKKDLDGDVCYLLSFANSRETKWVRFEECDCLELIDEYEKRVATEQQIGENSPENDIDANDAGEDENLHANVVDSNIVGEGESSSATDSEDDRAGGVGSNIGGEDDRATNSGDGVKSLTADGVDVETTANDADDESGSDIESECLSACNSDIVAPLNWQETFLNKSDDELESNSECESMPPTNSEDESLPSRKRKKKSRSSKHVKRRKIRRKSDVSDEESIEGLVAKMVEDTEKHNKVGKPKEKFVGRVYTIVRVRDNKGSTRCRLKSVEYFGLTANKPAERMKSHRNNGGHFYGRDDVRMLVVKEFSTDDPFELYKNLFLAEAALHGLFDGGWFSHRFIYTPGSPFSKKTDAEILRLAYRDKNMRAALYKNLLDALNSADYVCEQRYASLTVAGMDDSAGSDDDQDPPMPMRKCRACKQLFRPTHTKNWICPKPECQERKCPDCDVERVIAKSGNACDACCKKPKPTKKEAGLDDDSDDESLHAMSRRKCRACKQLFRPTHTKNWICPKPECQKRKCSDCDAERVIEQKKRICRACSTRFLKKKADSDSDWDDDQDPPMPERKCRACKQLFRPRYLKNWICPKPWCQWRKCKDCDAERVIQFQRKTCDNCRKKPKTTKKKDGSDSGDESLHANDSEDERSSACNSDIVAPLNWQETFLNKSDDDYAADSECESMPPTNSESSSANDIDSNVVGEDESLHANDVNVGWTAEARAMQDEINAMMPDDIEMGEPNYTDSVAMDVSGFEQDPEQAFDEMDVSEYNLSEFGDPDIDQQDLLNMIVSENNLGETAVPEQNLNEIENMEIDQEDLFDEIVSEIMRAPAEESDEEGCSEA